MKARRWFAALAGLSVAAVAAALVTQHVFDMQPCPWCVLQRLIFVAIALACVVGAVVQAPAGRLVSALSALGLAAAGVAAALWQHFVAAKSASCDLTLADRIVSGLVLDRLLPDVFAVRASCAEAAANVFGVPHEFWSLALYLAIGIGALALLRVRDNLPA